MIAAFVIGIALTGTSGPDRPDLPRWQQPGMGAVLVGGGALLLVITAGAVISLLRDRRRYRNATYLRLRSVRYRTNLQVLRGSLLSMSISACFIILGLWLRHSYG